MDVSSIAAKLRGHERRKEERRVVQMKNARAKARLMKKEKEEKAAKEGGKVAVEEGQDEESEALEISEEDAVNASLDVPHDGAEKRKANEDAVAGPSKKPKYTEEAEGGDDAAGDSAALAGSSQAQVVESAGLKEEEAVPAKAFEEPDVAWPSMVLTKPSPDMRGHTSYLTFATLYPAAIREEIAA